MTSATDPPREPGDPAPVAVSVGGGVTLSSVGKVSPVGSTDPVGVAVGVVVRLGVDVSVVVEALGLLTVAPVHLRNDCPAGGALAVIVTTLPAA